MNRKKVTVLRRDEAVSKKFDILKKSPCLNCPQYTEKKICQHVEYCPKIEEYQEIAAAHFSLFKDVDIHSILKL
ncbi:MAG: hypothetical protein ABIF87_05130 [Pseudomonadota bacterium]